MIISFLGFRCVTMYWASCGPWTSSRETTRKNVGFLPEVVSAGLVAEPVMNAMPARPNSGPTAWTSWLPAGPTTATIFEFEVNCWVTVVAWDGVELGVALDQGDVGAVGLVVHLDRELRERELLLTEDRDVTGEGTLDPDRGRAALG